MAGAGSLILGLAVLRIVVPDVENGQACQESTHRYQWLDDDVRLSPVPATQPAERPSTVALRFFEALPPGNVEAALRAVRPPPIAADERTRLLAMLPEAGELVPDAAEQPKLAALEPVLAFHERHGVLAVKVIDLPQAGLVIYQRSVLLVARPALRLLSTAELQAAVAHEIGHEVLLVRV